MHNQKAEKVQEILKFQNEFQPEVLARNSSPTQTVLANDVVTACGSYTWPVNGLVYNTKWILYRWRRNYTTF